MTTRKPLVRKASKRGTWYTGNALKLEDRIQSQMIAQGNGSNGLKSLIVPHAGYTYSLNTAMSGYSKVITAGIDTIFVIGVDHYCFSHKCFIPNCDEYESTFRNFDINKDIVQDLPKDLFELRERALDEKEHSVEIQIPILSYLFKDKKDVNLVPITVGRLGHKNMDRTAAILKEYYCKENTLFIISSDFCHWGMNFDYCRFVPAEYNIDPKTDIEAYVKALDSEAIGYILNNQSKELERYIARTGNTICGIYPIYLFMEIRKLANHSGKGELYSYSRSSKIKSQEDSSVGYAAIGFSE